MLIKIQSQEINSLLLLSEKVNSWFEFDISDYPLGSNVTHLVSLQHGLFVHNFHGKQLPRGFLTDQTNFTKGTAPDYFKCLEIYMSTYDG